ncbi:MAG: hypothetical protein ACLGHD_06740 [Actinomycetes bacterium]
MSGGRGEARDGGGGAFGGPVAGGGAFGGHEGGGGSFGGPGWGAAPAVAPVPKAGIEVAWDPSVTGAACAQLRDAAWRVRDAVRALHAAPPLGHASAPGIRVAALRDCAAAIDDRAAAAQALVVELDRLHDDTMLAGRAYELASDAVLWLVEELAGGVAWGAGVAARGLVAGAVGSAAAWMPLLAVGAGAALAIGLVAVPLAARFAATHPQHAAALLAHAEAAGVSVEQLMAQAASFWDRSSEALLAQPGFVGALGLAMESTDEALAGFLGVPLPVAARLESAIGQDEQLALLAAGAALGLRVGGGLSPVRAGAVTPVQPPVRPVSSPGQAMAIIRDQEQQVVVHELRMPDGSRRFQVFVRGTETFGTDPATGLDGPANVENAASTPHLLVGSDAAVAEAMVAAGVGPGDPVDLFGYSQGGAAVANVAASGRFDVESALLIGAPSATAEIPPEVAVLAVAHAGDPTPAADGLADGGGPPQILGGSAGGHGTGFAARHSQDEYVETLHRAARDDVVVARWTERMRTVTEGGTPVAGYGVHVHRE